MLLQTSVSSRFAARSFAVALGVLIALPSTALAQQADGLEEVTVTAQRREQSIQDVGIAIQAFTAEQIEKAGLQNTTDVARLTPGVFISGSSAGQNSQFTVRGVTQNDFNDAIEGPVAVYFDEGYVASSNGAIFGTFDLERVEILKGPQGTLFGRNATGGLIHFIPKKPTDEFDAYVDLTIGDNNQLRAEAAVGGPLGQRMSGRLSVFRDDYDNYMDNIYPAGVTFPGGAAGPPTGADLAGQESVGVRGQLQFDLGDAWDLRMRASYAKNEFGVAPYNAIPVMGVVDTFGRLTNTLRLPIGTPDAFGYVAPDKDRYATGSDFSADKAYFSEAMNGAIHLKYSGESFDFVSITDYKKFEKSIGVDVEASTNNIVNFGSDVDTKSLTQEFRFSGDTDRLNWVVGLFYLDIDANVQNGFMAPMGSLFNVVVLAGPPSGSDLVNDLGLDTKSVSVFGQVEYDLTEQWRLLVGARAVREEQDYAFRSDFRLNTNDYRLTEGPVLAPNIQPAFNDSRADSLFAGKVQLEYRPNDDWMWFAGFNRGVKGGSYNAMLPDGTPPLANIEIPYDAEVLHSLEVGFKSTLANGLVQFNGSAFYYDYSDYQAFTFANVSGTVTNNDAKNQGLEFDVSFRPIDGLTIALGASLFDAQVEQLAVAPGLVVNAMTNAVVPTPGFLVTADGRFVDSSGNPATLPAGTRIEGAILQDVEPTFAPKTQLSAQISYEMPVPSLADGTLNFGLNSSWSDDFWHNLRNHDADKLDGYSVTDIRVGWRSGDQRFGVTAFVNNVFDERYAAIGFNLAGLCACTEESYGRPRWWGVSFRYNFVGE